MLHVIAERIQRELYASPFLALRRVSVRVDGDSIILSGSVPRFYLRQQAISIALSHASVFSDCVKIH